MTDYQKISPWVNRGYWKIQARREIEEIIDAAEYDDCGGIEVKASMLAAVVCLLILIYMLLAHDAELLLAILDL
jgi:hypothetical protein